MTCPRCLMQNSEGAKFCTNCGNVLDITPSKNENLETPNNILNNQENVTNQIQPKENASVDAMKIGEYFSTIAKVIMKPYTTCKEELSKFNNFKNSVVLAIIIAILSTVITLLKTIYRMVHITNYWTDKTEWVWENLKNINYISVIGKNFLIYLGVIFAIAGIYYIASLVVKKQVNFAKLVGISGVSVVPVLVSSMILSPILTMIYAPLGLFISIIGMIYTIIILFETMSNEIELEGNIKYYFHLVCMSILAIGVYYLFMHFALSSISSGLSSISSMFD